MAHPDTTTKAVPPVAAGGGLAARLSLVLGGLAVGETRLAGREAPAATENALRALGARIERQGDLITVAGTGNGCLLAPVAPLEFGADGIGLMLAMGLVASYDFPVTFHAEPPLLQTAFDRLAGPLRQTGAQLGISAGGTAVTIAGSATPNPAAWSLPADATPEIGAALLLCALNAPGLSTLAGPAGGEAVERTLQAFGAELSAATGPDGLRVLTIRGRPRLVAAAASGGLPAGLRSP